jgi:hypothetical protein
VKRVTPQTLLSRGEVLPHTMGRNGSAADMDSIYSLPCSMEQSPFEKLTGLQPVKKFPTFYGT